MGAIIEVRDEVLWLVFGPSSNPTINKNFKLLFNFFILYLKLFNILI